MYFYIYTPSNQRFKAFLVSKFNSETSFLYQLFKENSNFIVTEPCKVISKSIFYDFHYYLYLFVSLFMHTPSYPHFKAFPVSKFNSETSFSDRINFEFVDYRFSNHREIAAPSGIPEKSFRSI